MQEKDVRHVRAGVDPAIIPSPTPINEFPIVLGPHGHGAGVVGCA
jgi:hypothetical protein